MCMMLAPASKAVLASRAISSGVTGTLCCFGSVSTPFSAQVMTALSLMEDLQIQRLANPEACKSKRLVSLRLCVGRQPASCVQPLPGCLHQLAAIDRKVARAGKDRARLQSVEAADRVAEMRGVGIAD